MFGPRFCPCALGAVLLLVLGGCGGQPPREPGATPPDPQVDHRPPPLPRDDTVTAHHPLLDAAGAAIERGDYDEALALLERAQRIAPDDGRVYLQMARAYLGRGDQQRARAVAERGLLYCDSAALCDELRRYAR